MIKNFVKWFFSPPIKPNFNGYDSINHRIDQLEERYQGLLMDVKRLEEENVETTNELYRLENSLDARIDILVEHCRINNDV